MGFVAWITEYFFNEGVPTIKGIPESGTILSISHFTPPGDDSAPMTTDAAACVDGGGTGTFSSVGYIDQENQAVANPGEKRLYSRSSDGKTVCTLYFKNDGSVSLDTENGQIEMLADGAITLSNEGSATGKFFANGAIQLTNSSGRFEIAQNGTVTINGVTIDTSGNITTSQSVNASSVVANGRELVNHTHGGVQSGGSTTGPNI